jgi:S-adenosylmethionine hydrolase
MPTPPIITLLTDFGTSDAYVGIMKGVALGICPAARLIDLTHEVPPQAIQLGALLLRSAVEFFPNGTVHLAIVDPGVGARAVSWSPSAPCSSP